MGRLRWGALAIALVPLISAGCGLIPRGIRVPQLLTPLAHATLEDLVARTNDWQRLSTLTARISIQVQTENSESGLARLYPSADGRLILARPQSMRLLIQAPLVKTKIADMATDGEKFRVIVYPEKYRMILQGTNQNDYSALSRTPLNDPTWQEVGGFRNMRPQHFSEAFLIESIQPTARLVPILEETRQIEEERSPGQKRRLVVRSYYVISLIEIEGNRGWVRRKIWFDRTRGLLLARQEIFGEGGEIVSDIRYDNYAVDARSHVLVPITVRISRPYDRYSARIEIDQTTLVVNGEVTTTAFHLEKPPEWEEPVKVIDLDKRRP